MRWSDSITDYLHTTIQFYTTIGLPWWLIGKNPPSVQESQKTWVHGFSPWVGKILWRRAWQPTPVLLPGEFLGQRRLAGYSSSGHKESDTTEATQHACTHSVNICMYKSVCQLLSITRTQLYFLAVYFSTVTILFIIFAPSLSLCNRKHFAMALAECLSSFHSHNSLSFSFSL